MALALLIQTPLFLQCLSLPSFISLSQTCRQLYYALDQPEVRDAVLSAFVPGYSFVRKNAAGAGGEVDISLTDLQLFYASQQTPLHIYPALALSSPSSPRTERLAGLACAHSRIVLLLQSMAHASSSPIPLPLHHWHEPETESLSPRLRELTFPAPLAPQQLVPSGGSAASSYPPSKRKEQSNMSSSPPKIFLTLSSKGRKAPPPPAVEPATLRNYGHGWRMSLAIASEGFRERAKRRESTSQASEFGQQRHKQVTTGSRFVEDTASEDGWILQPPRRRSTPPPISSRSSSSSPEASPFSSTPGSRRSSRGESPPPPNKEEEPWTQASSLHDILLATSRLRAPVLRVFVPCSSLSTSDYFTAHPQSKADSTPLAPAPSPQQMGSIELCERHLQNAGLWDHMSVGDVVVNLGYVPLSPRSRSNTPTPSLSPLRGEHTLRRPSSRVIQRSNGSNGGLLSGGSNSNPGSDSDSPPSSFKLNTNNGSLHKRAASSPTASDRRSSLAPSPRHSLHIPNASISSVNATPTWLIFTGSKLIPFSPPTDPLPAEINPWTLPSPSFYDHLLPVLSSPLRVRIPRFPVTDIDKVDLSLQSIPATVHSPSLGGMAWVKRWRWVARFRPTPIPREEIGAHWENAEWIVEGEGTREGREGLLSCLQDDGKAKDKEWEVVRERSVPGQKVWLKVIS
ncbi:hypothetical protein Moror_5785 [Moniliophthora roreri MCA 2997]|uniref:F-box domain-containing protein n=1 Tax=Moniliophthora roreri (strain MCA 2997) TaxID=1381753 RepID=V2Y6F3_MONRO|nr:hypothetical protein Moror_5785 [Moniliophthora roreri MCA 2997]